MYTTCLLSIPFR